MPSIQGQVGTQQLQTGVQANLALGKGAELLVSEFQAKYYSLCYAGKVYNTANQAVSTLSTLSTTYTGLMISNPFGSGFNSIVLQCCVAFASAPGGISTVHHEGAPAIHKTPVTQGTPNTVYNSLIGSPALGVTLGASASTPPNTPVVLRSIGCGVNATGSATTIPFVMDDIAGGMILQPGTYVGLGYVTTACNVIASYHWCELPI